MLRVFEGDEDARRNLLGAFLERSKWLAEAEERVNDHVEDASEVIQPD